MRSTSRPPLLAALLLLSTLSACQHPSTVSSIARTERPKLPTRSPELNLTEHVAPLGHPETGVTRLVDAGWLKALLDQHDELIGAVTRLNNRIGGNKKADRCIRAIFETGKPGPGCPAAAAP